MAWVSTTERPDDREESVTLRAGNYKRTRIRAYTVQFDDFDDGPQQARSAPDVPRVGDNDADDDTLVCRSSRANPLDDDLRTFKVVCTFEFETTYSGTEPGPGQFPSLTPGSLEWSFLHSTKIVTEDLTGKALASSAGEPFDPPLEIDDSMLTLTVNRDQFNFDAVAVAGLIGSVNDEEFYGAAEGTVKLADARASYVYENGRFIWKAAYIFHWKADGWNPVYVLDQGTRAWVQHGGLGEPSDWRLDTITDADGQPYNRQSLLDGSGQVLPISDPENPADPLAVHRAFDVYPSADLGALLRS